MTRPQTRHFLGLVEANRKTSFLVRSRRVLSAFRSYTVISDIGCLLLEADQACGVTAIVTLADSELHIPVIDAGLKAHAIQSVKFPDVTEAQFTSDSVNDFNVTCLCCLVYFLIRRGLKDTRVRRLSLLPLEVPFSPMALILN